MASSLDEQIGQPRPLGRGRIVKILLFLAVAGGVAGLLIARGIHARTQTSASVAQDTQQMADFTVSVVAPKPGTATNEVVLTGALQPFMDAPIYARANGYVKEWHANIGDRVKNGQILAELEAPEVDLQISQAQATLEQARAALAQAQANLVQAQVTEHANKQTADRYSALTEQGIFAPQDNDQKQGTYKASVASRQAMEQAVNVSRATIATQEANIGVLNQMRTYLVVRAPFDGVITARRTDVGALITAGSTSSTTELFHMASVDQLRVYTSIPEVYSRAAIPGLTADLTLEEFPNRRFPARLARTNGTIDSTTRTLLTEFDIDNSSGTLRAGSYAEVHLKLPSPGRTLLVPVSAVMFRAEGSQVGVVGPDGKAKLVPVTLGKDYGTIIEIVSGINEHDKVIETPPDSLVTGMPVRVIEKATPAK